MSTLGPSERAMLAAYRERESLGAAHRRRLWRGVQAREAQQRAARWRRRAVVLVAAAVVALVVGQQWSEHAARELEREAGRNEAHSGGGGRAPGGSRAARGARERKATVQDAAPPEVAPAVGPTEEPPSSSASSSAGAPKPSPKPSPKRSAAAAAEVLVPLGPEVEPAKPEVQRPAASGVEAESRVLHQARLALSRGELGRARDVLEQHRERFPSPILEQEREALVAIVRCRQEGTAVALQAFRTRFPASALLGRVERECSGDSTEGIEAGRTTPE